MVEGKRKAYVCLNCRVWFPDPVGFCPDCSTELLVCYRRSGRFHFYEQDLRRKPKPCPHCGKNMTATRHWPKVDTSVPFPMELRKCEDCQYGEKEELHYDHDSADYLAQHEIEE